jgi:hypothetical protein
MHEIHPAHSTASWKDILLHIGIITIGLLMALGIDQTVEHFHHRHQLAEARRQIKNEHELNKFQYRQNHEFLKRQIKLYQDDLLVVSWLKVHPHAPRESWPAKFVVFDYLNIYDSDAWSNFKQSPLLDMMPYAEQRRWLSEYLRLSIINASFYQLIDEGNKISALSYEQPDLTKMTPAQLDALSQQITLALVSYKSIVTNCIMLNKILPDDYAYPDDLQSIFENRGDFTLSQEDQQNLATSIKEFLKARGALE